MNDRLYAAEAEDLCIIRGHTSILRGVNCQIESGKCTAILGPNGGGKTTFTRALTGHCLISRGTLRVLGETVGKTDIRALRRRIGVVNSTIDSSGYHVSGAVVDADLTAHDAVVTGYFATVGLYDQPNKEQHRRADQLLERVGLAHRRDLCFGLLSIGEQRRCLIARALVHIPELLILDEPTAGLDVAGREHVLATIESILRSADPPAVLLITHHVEELSAQTRQVLLMREGRIIAAGAPEKIITPGSLTDTFGCRVFVERRNGRFWLQVLPEAWLDL